MEYKNIIKNYLINELLGTSHEYKTEITDDTYILSDDYLNSLDIVKLIVFLEDKFNIELINEKFDIKNFSTISQIGLQLESRLTQEY